MTYETTRARLRSLVAGLFGASVPTPAELRVCDPPVVCSTAGDSPAERARRAGVDELTIEDYALWSQRSR
jgi:hypothetical protein